MSRFAWVGLDRQIHVANADGTGAFQLTAPITRSAGGWALMASSTDAWSWPTWSADGTWIAAFAVETSDTLAGPVRVHGLALDGVREVEWARLSGMAPIYLQWHPSGEALTLLMQQDEELVLGLVHRDRLGVVRPVEHGVPLFFNWSGDGERILLHASSRSGGDGRITLRDPLGDAEDTPWDLTPGSFCAPVFAGGSAITAERAGEGRSRIVATAWDGTGGRELAIERGLLAIVPAPGGTHIAISHAPRGEGSAYRGIDIVDVRTGERRSLFAGECVAFFWAPRGEWLLVAQIDSEDNCVRWLRVWADGRGTDGLATFWPTRDIRFYLHFFDQYATSHSLVSADGRFLVYAGYPAGDGQADLSSPPRIYVKDTSALDSPPEDLGQGTFAVFAPAG